MTGLSGIPFSLNQERVELHWPSDTEHMAQHCVRCANRPDKLGWRSAEYLQSMCSDCVDEAGDTPRDDEDDDVDAAASAIPEAPAAIDDACDRDADGERLPWRLWSIWVTTSVPFQSGIAVFYHISLQTFIFTTSQGHNHKNIFNNREVEWSCHEK